MFCGNTDVSRQDSASDPTEPEQIEQFTPTKHPSPPFFDSHNVVAEDAGFGTVDGKTSLYEERTDVHGVVRMDIFPGALPTKSHDLQDHPHIVLINGNLVHMRLDGEILYDERPGDFD
jgi:hypothetical protein